MSQYDRFPMQGGLDLSTPYIARTPGSLLQSQNYEPDTDGGYRVMGGFERFDGGPSPSAATLYSIHLTTNAPTDGTASFGRAWQTVNTLKHFNIVEPREGDPTELWVDIVDSPLAVGETIQPILASGVTRPTYTVAAITQVLPDVENIQGVTYPDGYLIMFDKTSTFPNATTFVPGATITGRIGGGPVVATGTIMFKMEPTIFTTMNLAHRALVYVNQISGDFSTIDTVAIDPPSGQSFLVSSSDVLEPYLQDPRTPQGALYAAQENRRGRIFPAGPKVLGVWDFKGDVYCITGTPTGAGFGQLLKATPDLSWQPVNLGFTTKWTGRPSDVTDLDLIRGDVVTGATSGATATVGYVGYITANHSEGFFSFVTGTGNFTVGEDLKVGTKVIGKSEGSTANSLPGSGQYRFFNHNFAAGLDQYSMYAANGVGPAFAFDGVNFVSIQTGTVDNRPFEVKVHYDHLFLAFPNGSLQHSVVGNPLDWSGGTGALELGIGANITDLIITPKSLIICSEKDIQVLLGTGLDTWSKDVVTTHTGVRKFTGQYQSIAYVMARPGLIAIDRVDTFGNFADAVISDKIRDLITARFDLWGPGVADKTKSQYRLYGSDGFNLVFSLYQGELQGIMPFSYGIPVRNVANPNGRIFFTSDSGYVYQSDVGPNNDGKERVVFLRTSYANQGDPDTRKRFRRCAVSISGSVFREMGVSFAFDKGRSTTPNSFISDMVNGAGGRWSLNEWDRIYWDGPDVEEIRKDMDGVGSDVSVIIYQSSRAANRFVIEDVSYEYEPRRKVR